MVGKEKRTKSYILTVVGVIIALYVLFPFFLVVLNSFKAQASIVESPVAFKGASFGQLMKNLNAVINNSNFQFWYAFGTSAVITIISLGCWQSWAPWPHGSSAATTRPPGLQ